MKLYLNCYVVGEGYTLKRAAWPDTPQLEEISRQQFPGLECNIFTGPDAPHLFLGTVDGLRFGCVRNLKTDMKDENGRRCFFHFALEADEDETKLVDSILMFALASRSRFAEMCVKTVEYIAGDYCLVPENFAGLLDAAKIYSSVAAPSGVLVPENLPEGFFGHSGIAPKDVKEVLTLDEWKGREALPLELFLYCSTPSSGFTLCQINPISGEKMKSGKEAHTCLLPYAQIILHNSGASMALFEQSDKICFIGKGIQSTTEDRYGRKKRMSVVLQAVKGQALQVRQMAAWALLDYGAFCARLTDCVSVYDGPRGFEVSGEKISRLLELFSREIVLPEGSRCRQAWGKVVGVKNQRQFRYFVAEASLDYFCRFAQVDLSEDDISWLIPQTEFERFQDAPANLEFKPELYKKPAQSKVDVVPVIKTVEEKSDVKKQVAAKEESKFPQTVQREELNPKEQRENSQGDPDEYIDLLQTKWFLPAMAIGILAVVGAIVLWLFRGK